MVLDVPQGTPDNGPGVVVMLEILTVLTILVSAARVASKFVVKQYWWWDDFFALLSLVSSRNTKTVECINA